MTRDLRIVFMGTPQFAVATLKALVEHHYTVVGVVTAPDRPAGRGRKLRSSAVKDYALEIGVPILQPTNLKNEYFLRALKALDPNLHIVVAFRMLPEVVWKLPQFGTFNLHASCLPEYRGAAPINWAIINGESKTGVTTFFIDEKIDTGEIILQREVAITNDDNAGSLHDKLMLLGSDLVIETVKQIENDEVKTTKQPQNSTFKPAPKLTKENCQLEWQQDVKTIYNKIRGLSPYPAAWSTLINNNEETVVKFYKVDYENEMPNEKIGSIIVRDNSVKVAAKNGFIVLYEIQLAGRKRMDIKSLLNGFQFHDKAYMR